VAKGNTPEGKVKAAVNKVFALYPETYVFMSVPYGYGKSTIDYLACHYGEFIGVETKAPGEVPTPRQEDIIWDINTARGVTFVIDNVDGCGPLAVYLELVKQNATRTSQPQAQNGRRPVRRKRPEPVSGGEGLGVRGCTASAPAAHTDRDLSPTEAWLRCTVSDTDALRLVLGLPVQLPKKHRRPSDA
jgi:hypothetical protein